MVYFGKSNRDGKKLKIVFIINGKKKMYHFGSDGSQTFSEGASETTKKAYIARHKVREDWSKINSGSLSRFILWGKHQDINKNLKSFLKRFNISNRT